MEARKLEYQGTNTKRPRTKRSRQGVTRHRLDKSESLLSTSLLSTTSAAQSIANRKNTTAATMISMILRHRIEARKMAQSMLKRWGVYMDQEDLYSHTDLALCVAARRYNPLRKTRFSTFLFYHLKGELVAAIKESKKQLAQPEGSAADIQQLQYRLKRTVGNRRAIRIDEEEDELSLSQQAVYTKQLRKILSTHFSKLRSVEKLVIFRCFFRDERISVLAKELGCTRCHVSRIKRQALEKLRRGLREERY